MLRCLRLLLIVVAPCMSAVAQRSATGVLVGRVLDARAGTPVAGSELLIPSKNLSAIADSSGKYRFEEVPGGVYAIQVRRLGFRRLTQDISVIVGAENESDFRLTRVVTLDTVETKAPAVHYISPALRGFEERRKVGIGYFIDEAELRKNDNSTLGNTLKRIPGIRVSLYNTSEFVASSRSAGGGHAGALTGAAAPKADPARRDSPRGCWVAVYLDGVNLYNGDPSQQAPDLAKILVKELAAAEFYGGSAALPAQFSAIKSSDCGVLLLWTRER